MESKILKTKNVIYPKLKWLFVVNKCFSPKVNRPFLCCSSLQFGIQKRDMLIKTIDERVICYTKI